MRRDHGVAVVVIALVITSALVSARAETEVLQLDERLPDYQRSDIPADGKRVRSAGSSTLTPLVHRWSEEFRKIYPTVQFDIAGGGTAAGFAALLQGSADLAAMSRPASAREIEAFSKTFGYPPAQIVIGTDAVAIYVNKNNPLQRISLTQLDALFSASPKRGGAQIKTWGELGVTGALADKPVRLRGPSRSHGLYALFRDDVLQGVDYRLEMQSEIVPSVIVQNVGIDPAAIGFASRYYASQRTRMLSVSETPDSPAAAPTQANSLNGSYPLARQLFFYVNRKPQTAVPTAIASFVRFVCSKQGQAAALQEGSLTIDAGTAERGCLERIR